MAANQEELSVSRGADAVMMFTHVNSHQSDTRKGGGKMWSEEDKPDEITKRCGKPG